MNLFEKIQIPVSELRVIGEKKAPSRIKLFSDFSLSKKEVFVSKSVIREFIHFKREQGCGNKYLHDIKRILKKAINLWLEENTTNPFYHYDFEKFFGSIKIKTPETSIRPEMLPAKDELYSLILKVQKPRYQLIFVFLYYSGMRPQEMRNVKLSDIARKRLIEGERVYDVISIFAEKTQKQRYLKIPTEVIDDILKIYRPSVYLFENINGKPYTADRLSQIVRENLRKHTDIKFTPYLFRHSSCSNYFELTGDFHSGAERAGHSVVTQLKTYVHVKIVDKSEVITSDYSTIRKGIMKVKNG